MAFTYYPSVASGHSLAEINQEELQHHYYARLSPDGQHLVPGILVQEERPATGKWIDVGNVTRIFPARYFVQYTDFNTLVPGSLVQADRLPAGKWKEIKQSTAVVPFHHVSFSPPPYGSGSLSDITVLANGADFRDDIWLPVYEEIHPGVVVDADHIVTATFYYFLGTFAELDKDITKLQSFMTGDTFLHLSYVFDPEALMDGLDTLSAGTYNLSVRPATPDGFYCIILAIWDADIAEIKEYIVLENVFEKISD